MLGEPALSYGNVKENVLQAQLLISKYENIDTKMKWDCTLGGSVNTVSLFVNVMDIYILGRSNFWNNFHLAFFWVWHMLPAVIFMLWFLWHQYLDLFPPHPDFPSFYNASFYWKLYQIKKMLKYFTLSLLLLYCCVDFMERQLYFWALKVSVQRYSYLPSFYNVIFLKYSIAE